MEIVNIRLTSPSDTFQNYEDRDITLISTARVSRPFGLQQDYVEYFIYDSNDTILSTNYFVDSFTADNTDPVTGLSTVLNLDPEEDIRAAGYNRGSVKITYNFFRKLFRSSVTDTFWIKEISGDRTELRVCRQDLSNLELQQAFNDYNLQVSTKAYYPDFYLNFGDNRLLIAVNVLYALQDEEGCLLLKLYEPLPDDIILKDTFWIVDKLSDEVAYEVTIDVPLEEVIELNTLRGPNYSVDLLEKINQTTPVYNYTTLFQTSVSASYQQIRSMMEEKGLDINVDYTDFSNFVHFSSATERINNFAYKVSLLDQYQNDIVALGSVASNNSTIISGSRTTLQARIDSLIEKFDGYEYYLYFESSSTTWPKSNTTRPYTLYPATSSQALNWLGGINTLPTAVTQSILYSASLYDYDNKDAVINTIPEYLKQDTSNLPYQTFLNMVGQHFDNIWIYLKDVTERYDADNRLTSGISKDLVGDALRALGTKLYTNTSISDNIYYSMLAINPDGSTIPPTGSEVIKYYIPYAANGLYVVSEYVDLGYVEAYISGQTIAGDDITKSYYKRLYHNLPYLLKTKGTQRGLKALINCFGIPDTILRINEYGGSDKSYTTPDLVQKRHTLAYSNNITDGSAVRTPWAGQYYYSLLNAASQSIVPDTIEFRFKSSGIPTGSYVSQSVFQLQSGSAATTTISLGVNLVYDSGSAIPSSSYENYGNMSLYINGATGFTKTSPLFLPFYDTNLWWNIMIKRESGSGQVQSNTTSNKYWLYAKSTAYDEEGNGLITFQGSQSIYINGTTSASYNASWNTVTTGSTDEIWRGFLGGKSNNNILCPDGTYFRGYFQDFRYWATPLSESAFDQHVIDSLSYRGNNPTASLYDLTFWLPLGSNLNVPYRNSSGIDTNAKDYDLYELGIASISGSTVASSYHPAITGTIYLPPTNLQYKGIPSFVTNGGSTTFSYGIFNPTANARYFQPFEVTDLIPTPASGIGQKVNNKVTVDSGSSLAETVLSPYVSIQRPNQDMSKNSTDLEIGFSPSDVLDLDIASQLGYFNIDQYIGAPKDAYSSSYVDLDTLRNTYFQKYLSKYNVKDFIRLIKYYDNSLFKMIKDFVPARANVATGIIVKPHILNRPKYPRNEPAVTTDNTYTGSINMVTISGSNPEDTYLNTSYTEYIPTVLGIVTQSRTDLREPFTGDFKGTQIDVSTGYFPQIETSFGLSTGSRLISQSIDPLQNNALTDLKSIRFLQTDYSSNINTPVNLGAITGALALYESRSIDPASGILTGSGWPFAYVNDYNWRTYARLNPRYEGTRITSLLYNEYSAPSRTWEGDISYGNTAVIDKYKYQYAYIVNIYTPTNLMINRSSAQIKYLIDNNENTLNLTKANSNIFDVQNIYKSGETSQVALFDYNPSNPDVQVLTNNKTLQLYEGGWRYSPILIRVSGSIPLRYDYTVPYFSSSIVPAPSAGLLTAPQPNYWSRVDPDIDYGDIPPGSPTYPYIIDRTGDTLTFHVTASAVYNASGTSVTSGYSTTAPVQITLTLDPQNTAATNVSITFTIPTSAPLPYMVAVTTPAPSKWFPGDYYGVASITQYQIDTGGTTTLTQYFTSASDYTADWYAENTTTVRMSATQSLTTIYGLAVQAFTGSTFPAPDSSLNIELPVFPIELNSNDMVKFYSPTAGDWVEEEEYRVVSSVLAESGSSGTYYRYLTLDRALNPVITTSGSIPGPISRYLALKHIPDETNLILRYAPQSQVTQEGLVYPQYLEPTVKTNAGNVVQSLKANNLI